MSTRKRTGKGFTIASHVASKELLERIKQRAQANKRTISVEVKDILESALTTRTRQIERVVRIVYQSGMVQDYSEEEYARLLAVRERKAIAKLQEDIDGNKAGSEA